MRTINKALIGLAVAGAGFATVGAGAGADFISTPTTHETITTGTVLITLSDNVGDGPATSDAVTPASLTLKPIGPTQSSFSDVKKITATNNGTVNATINTLKLATSGADVSPLASDLGTVVYDGAFTQQICSGTVAHCTGVNLLPGTGAPVTLAPGQSLTVIVQTVAGGNSGFPSLTNQDEGKTMNEALTYSVTG